MYYSPCVFVAFVVAEVSCAMGVNLGAACTSDDECETQYSRCHLGTCSCLPYYAQHDSKCLQSTLLGFECLVDEQCSQKVANSSCIGNVCRCDPGFLQFRRHTCLTPAKLGEVCYSDTHCRLWDNGSHCDFLIPKLFGRCVCTPPLRQSVELSCVPPSTRPHKHSNGIHTVDQTTQPTKIKISSTKLPANTITTISTGKYTNTKHVQQSSTKLNGSVRPLRTPAPTESFPDVVYTKLLHRTPMLTTVMPETKLFAPSRPLSTGILLRGEEWNGIVSLGLPCTSDKQCRASDPASRCIAGVCDCLVRSNLTDGCSARNRGCHAGTFQCRATGICISWYFVCDGRRDCQDGSDEVCNRNHCCPETAFHCWKSSNVTCVSAAARCDGIRDCASAEDEDNCTNSVNTGCPAGTFQCSNGNCIPDFEFCNAVVTCPDGSDEPDHACKASISRPDADIKYCPFRCANGRCRSSAVACSGRDGCGDGSDEERCTVCKCPSM